MPILLSSKKTASRRFFCFCAHVFPVCHVHTLSLVVIHLWVLRAKLRFIHATKKSVYSRMEYADFFVETNIDNMAEENGTVIQVDRIKRYDVIKHDSKPGIKTLLVHVVVDGRLHRLVIKAKRDTQYGA